MSPFLSFQIQDSSFGGGSSSDEDDHINSGKHHLYIQQQNSLINLLLYVGLCIISLGLIISFVGTGEKGFKTNELRLIGPCLLLIGCVFCGLRVLFCFCRVNSKFCRKKSNLHHQQFIKNQQTKQAKIMAKQMQQTKESSQHHLSLLDDTTNSNLDFYKCLPFHNRTNEFVSEPISKQSDFDGRKRVSIIPPSRSQTSELNKTLMFNPNQLLSYKVPTVKLPKSNSNPTPSTIKEEEKTNLIDFNYSASMNDLLSLSSIEDLGGNDDHVEKISLNSVTMKQLKSTIITLDNNDTNNCTEYSNVISNSCEDLHENETNLPLSSVVDFNYIESNVFNLQSSDLTSFPSSDKKCDSYSHDKENEIELNQFTNHDRIPPSIPRQSDFLIDESVVNNISDDSKLEHLKLRSEKQSSTDTSLDQNTNFTHKPESINLAPDNNKIKSSTEITPTSKKSMNTMALTEIKQETDQMVPDKSGTKTQQDKRENKLSISKDTKLGSLVDRVNKPSTIMSNNIKTNSIMKETKVNGSHNKATKLNLLDGKDLKTALNRNNMKNTKSNSGSKKVNFSTPNSKNSIELIETHKKYNKSDCISLNNSADSMFSVPNEHELVLSPLNLKSPPKS